MSKLERYILVQIIGPFGFFTLILTGVIWLTQSLTVIDTVINHGQSALVFLKFTALLLPLVFSVVLPIAGFAAALYALNRLLGDSEVIVMFASGMSRLRLAWPVSLFGVMLMLVMLVVTSYLMPTAARDMRERIAVLRNDIATSLIRDGRFLHPESGLTIYIRSIVNGAEMFGVLVHDRRDPAGAVTYLAKRAAMTRGEEGPRLVMFDGTAQRVDQSDKRLSLLRFKKLAYDLSRFMGDKVGRNRKPSELYAPQLLSPPAKLVAANRHGKWIAEGHEQLSAPLYALALPLIALAGLLGGAFQRHGYGLRIFLTIGVGAGVRIFGLAAKAEISATPEFWPVMYVIPLTACIAALWVLARSSGGAARSRRQCRKVAP